MNICMASKRLKHTFWMMGGIVALATVPACAFDPVDDEETEEQEETETSSSELTTGTYTRKGCVDPGRSRTHSWLLRSGQGVVVNLDSSRTIYVRGRASPNININWAPLTTLRGAIIKPPDGGQVSITVTGARASACYTLRVTVRNNL
jgi:hypothetical protein